MKSKKVCWISAGVSSFIAGYLAKDVDEYLYIDVPDQHEDSMRFIKDCEKVLGKPITILKDGRTVEEVIHENKYINGVRFAPCTAILKRRVRQLWEQTQHHKLTYVWGFDIEEVARAKRMQETVFEYGHEFPLIENNLSKKDCHGLLKRLGIKRPIMYDLGYSNNNCIGCVKGGMGYWNAIRNDFPEVFERRAKLEREIGHSCIKGVFLDELEQDRGRRNEIIEDCSLMCELVVMNGSKT